MEMKCFIDLMDLIRSARVDQHEPCGGLSHYRGASTSAFLLIFILMYSVYWELTPCDSDLDTGDKSLAARRWRPLA